MRFVHESEDATKFEVVRRGDAAPPVILLHEVWGMTQACLNFAELIARRGFSVYLPLLFGEEGQPASAAAIARFCVRREVLSMTFRSQSHSDGPVAKWLRSLAARLHADPAHSLAPGVGVIGMCLTGRFALSTMLAFPIVRAGVMCQSATPAAFGHERCHASGINQRDVVELRATLPDDAPSIMAVAFENDCISPARRLVQLQRDLGPCFEAILLPSGRPSKPPRRAHSVFTGDYPAVVCVDIDAAFERVIAGLAHRLQPPLQSSDERDAHEHARNQAF
jgi:dienelactone hydrolase